MDGAADRKAQIRTYKETPRPMGVYRVRNTVNARYLIGSSVNLAGILNRHRFELQMGSHPVAALQDDWNEMGPNAFEFEVLDTLAPSDEPGADVRRDLRTLEDIWVTSLCDSEGTAYGSEAPSGT